MSLSMMWIVRILIGLSVATLVGAGIAFLHDTTSPLPFLLMIGAALISFGATKVRQRQTGLLVNEMEKDFYRKRAYTEAINERRLAATRLGFILIGCGVFWTVISVPFVSLSTWLGEFLCIGVGTGFMLASAGCFLYRFFLDISGGRT